MTPLREPNEARGPEAAEAVAREHGVTLREATRTWARIAALSFGGPAGQIATMHRILVDEKRWIGEERFLHALSFCTLLPGPEAQQLAIYVGWLMHGVRGGVIAGVLFVLPGLVAIMALSVIYVAFGQGGIVGGLFFGLKCAVLAVVLQAVFRIGARALRTRTHRAIAAAAFLALYAFGVGFPLVVLAAGLLGFVLGRVRPEAIGNGAHEAVAAGPSEAGSLLGEGSPAEARFGVGASLRIGAVLLALWLGPTALLLALLGPGHVFTDVAVFFSKMAVVTFGGAYAVLAYVAQEAVETFRWVTPGEMLDGLGLAETTPGPLIMVTQFVGFMAAFRSPGALNPYLAGALGGLLTTWVTFAPCFLWIFLGAPHVEALRGHRALSAALAAITAAVVGVILNLALWLAAHVLFAQTVTLRPGLGLGLEVPVLASANGPALALTAAATLAVFRFKAGIIPTLVAAAAVGVALRLAGLA